MKLYSLQLRKCFVRLFFKTLQFEEYCKVADYASSNTFEASQTPTVFKDQLILYEVASTSLNLYLIVYKGFVIKMDSGYYLGYFR